MARILLAACVLLLFALLGRADTLILKNGSSITGTVLADRETEVIIDIGVDVLKIPREKILRHEKAKPDEPKDKPVKAKTLPGDSKKLYKTAKLTSKTLEDSVYAVSEAVVMVTSPGGAGSGFFINQQGYLITNYHVIERETRIEVTLFQKTPTGLEKKKFKKVRIEAINPFVDLALLKVEDLGPDKPKHVYLGDMSKVTAGQRVFAVGNPMGLERSVSQGIVSTPNRAFEGLLYIQTTAPINPGNSGGPLFNLAGEVIGVTNMGYIMLDGLGFAIPINYVKQFIENRDAFAYDKDNPNSGYRYIQPQRRLNKNNPPLANNLLQGDKK